MWTMALMVATTAQTDGAEAGVAKFLQVGVWLEGADRSRKASHRVWKSGATKANRQVDPVSDQTDAAASKEDARERSSPYQTVGETRR